VDPIRRDTPKKPPADSAGPRFGTLIPRPQQPRRYPPDLLVRGISSLSVNSCRPRPTADEPSPDQLRACCRYPPTTAPQREREPSPHGTGSQACPGRQRRPEAPRAVPDVPHNGMGRPGGRQQEHRRHQVEARRCSPQSESDAPRAQDAQSARHDARDFLSGMPWS